MPVFTAGSQKLEADLFVFDKDGLMFDSEQFWIELSNERCRNGLALLTGEQAVAWLRLLGADTKLREGGLPETVWVNPLGITATAAPYEERLVTAGYLAAVKGWPWYKARAAAVEFLDRCDRSLDLKKALRPQPGFVELMRRLAALDIPYGVATSDTFDRTRDSMTLYGCWDPVRFVITPEDVKEGKPAPDMLRLISKKTGVPPDRIAMVGDSCVDVEMAAAAGSIGIGVSDDPAMREKMKPFASVIIRSLREIIL